MKALRFHAAKDLRVEDIPQPTAPGDDEVVIKNRFVGICGTDLHEYAYGPIFIPKEPHPFTGAHGPQVLGHEFGGVVTAVGAGVTHVQPGDRVAAYFHTGGTTGMPKVAQHKVSGMVYNGWLGQRLLFNEQDTVMCPLPLFHVFAAYPVLMSMIASGAHVVFPTPAGYRGEGVFDNLWKLIERYRCTYLITVPTALAALMQRCCACVTRRELRPVKGEWLPHWIVRIAGWP